ncbi:hypothetical protein GRN71_004428 [Salmonella enterica subsp. enterica serovar Thompson]|nr:hypothetical protein [Salmonella enterica subsp. enterica serovar Thompson]
MPLQIAPVEIVRVIAAELQERRKADNQEPAGYHVIKECGKVGCSVATLEEAEKTRDFWNKKWTIRPYFYSAAPAPVVPEEMPKGLADQIVSLLAHNIGDKFLAQKIWNACRAAMLQGSQPVSNRDGLSSPVIPDGYALVPVEPTPEMREAFHVANEEYESGSYDVLKPDHQWQAMLAAAPQLKIALASIERCQAGFDAKHALFEVAIARFSKMNEGFPIKRFKADWVISWMLENFPPVAQKQGDN